MEEEEEDEGMLGWRCDSEVCCWLLDVFGDGDGDFEEWLGWFVVALEGVILQLDAGLGCGR